LYGTFVLLLVLILQCLPQLGNLLSKLACICPHISQLSLEPRSLLLRTGIAPRLGNLNVCEHTIYSDL
jgi:hypothetical protein